MPPLHLPPKGRLAIAQMPFTKVENNFIDNDLMMK